MPVRRVRERRYAEHEKKKAREARRKASGRASVKAGKMLSTMRSPTKGGDEKKKKQRETSSFAQWLTSGGRKLLRCPAPTFPSGQIDEGKPERVSDLHVVQVAASDAASYAREVSYAEAVGARVGLERMEQCPGNPETTRTFPFFFLRTLEAGRIQA